MERLWKKIHLKDSSFSTDWHFWITGCSISAMHQRWWWLLCWLQLWWWWWRWLWLNCETCTAEALEGGRPPRIQTGQNIRSGRDLEMKIHHQPSTTKANNSKNRNRNPTDTSLREESKSSWLLDNSVRRNLRILGLHGIVIEFKYTFQWLKSKWLIVDIIEEVRDTWLRPQLPLVEPPALTPEE